MKERLRRRSVTVVALLVLAAPTCLKRGGPRSDAAANAPRASTSTRAPIQDAATDALDATAAAAAAANLAAHERAKTWLTDLRWMVAHNATTNPAKAGEGDAVSKCDAVTNARAALNPDADADHTKTLEDAAALCAFDVPLATASEALNQLRHTPSQASRLLGCSVSKTELDKARAVNPRERKLLGLDARRAAACNR